MTIVKNLAHQGDVSVHKVSTLPQDATRLESENGKTILALGEATGHHHRFETDNVEMFTANDNGIAKRFIVISKKPATLFHEEHSPITFSPGTYEVKIARQWTDENEPIAVRD